MGFLNKKRSKKSKAKRHLNWMGGTSFDIQDPLLRLRLAASSCFFGEPQYYLRDKEDARPKRQGYVSRLADRDLDRLRETLNAMDPQDWRTQTPAEALETAIDAALAHDPERTLMEAVRLRQEEHIRTTPQVILVRAANAKPVKGTGLVRKYAKDIIRRADEPAVGLAYQLARYGKPIPNALKKSWRDALSGYSDYALAKYRLENREVKTVDVMNLVHPDGDAVSRLAKGELRTTNKTWEAIVSKRGANQAAWMEALPVMGHMALLRNLRNLVNHQVPEKAYLDRLVEGAEKGQQLPFRYYSAYRALEGRGSRRLLGAVEDALMASLGNLPYFRGRTMSLCDNSGSALGTTTSSMGTMRVASIANLTGVLAGMRSEDGWLGIFGDRLEARPVSHRASIFHQLTEADRVGDGIGAATENGVWLFWDRAIRKREHWDNVFVFSDMQAGHGGLFGVDSGAYRDYRWSDGHHIDVAKLVATYRKRVNPQVNVFLVQVAGYQDTLMPEFYERTYILGGWGEGLLRFAANMSQLVN